MKRLLIVLLLLASISCSGVRERPKQMPIAWDTEMARGTSRLTTVTVTNRCRQTHGFSLSTDAPELVAFPETTTLELTPGGTRTVPVRFSATGTDAGIVEAQVVVQCEDCDSEPKCLQDRDVFLARLTVVESEPPQAAALPIAPLGCVPRYPGGKFEDRCRSEGWGCLVMFPDMPTFDVVERFGDSAIYFSGQAQITPDPQPSLQYHFSSAVPENIEAIPLETAVPLSGESAALLGFERVTLLPGHYEIDRSVGRFGAVRFAADVAGARDAAVLQAYYLERWSDLPIANTANPYDFVGLYHNAGVDFVTDLSGGGVEAGDADCDPVRGLVARVARFADLASRLHEESSVREQAWMGLAIASDALREAPPGSDAPVDAQQLTDEGLALVRDRLTPQQYEHFADAWRQLAQLLEAADSGAADYTAYQRGVAEVEAELASRAPAEDPAVLAPTWMVLATARYSAHLANETGISANAPRRIKWWKVAKQDLLGAATGVPLGPWGSVAGGVVFSAAEIEGQRSSKEQVAWEPGGRSRCGLPGELQTARR